MKVTLGPGDEDAFLDPRPDLLRRVSRIEPEPGGLHVLLAPFGIRSTQRLALCQRGDAVISALWPAELKPQAAYLYGGRLATPMIRRAREVGWSAEASPHLAFRNSPAGQRLYMHPQIDALEYAKRWEDGDLGWVGQYSRPEVQATLYPWLLERGYLEADDGSKLTIWVAKQLGNRPAYLRPGLRLKGRYSADDSASAERVRGDVDAILAAAKEPPLPEHDSTRS